MFEKKQHGRLFALAAIAASIWLCFALLAVTTLSPASRLLSFALVTGALLVAGLYEMNKKDRAWKQSVLLLTAAWFVCAATLYAARLAAPEKDFAGPLLAGNLAAPVTACAGTKIGTGDLLMIVGRNGVIGQGPGPFTPFRAGSCPALAITRTARGLMVNGFGYDSDNNVVYRIKDNVFEQIVGGFLRQYRPDPSRLAIGDGRWVRALDVHYLNKNSVEIEGTFRCGDTLPVTVSPDGVHVGHEKMDENRCITLDGKVSGLTFSGPPSSHS